MKELERIHASASIEYILEIYERDGGVIIEEMVPPAVINELREAADAFAKRITPGSATQGMGEDGADFVGANTVRFSSLGLITPAYFELLDNPIYASIADAVLLPNCGSYWVNTGQVMYINPGEPAQVLHRDANNWWQYVEATWPDSKEITISAMIGLDEVTEELGATRVVPGSHQEAELMRWGDSDTVPAELGPGDGLIYSGYVQHGGGANRTDRVRRALHLSYVVGWLTPEEASPIDFATDDLADQSQRVQRLLGHRSYDPRPLRGGGLWLRHVKGIVDDQPSLS
jgi:ectoine hydroxylase-related dioxygenase (phytanoyl-CoA dioxygenase family)